MPSPEHDTHGVLILVHQQDTLISLSFPPNYAKYTSPAPTMPQPPHHPTMNHNMSYHQHQHIAQQPQQISSQSVPMASPPGPQQQPQIEQQHTIHPAVQKLYEQQQTLLEKLQLLEQDDPDPQSAKVEYTMSAILRVYVTVH